jgi:hypothetical protein
VQALYVVPALDPFEERGAGGGSVGQWPVVAEQFVLQGGEEGLSEGVVPALPGASD